MIQLGNIGTGSRDVMVSNRKLLPSDLPAVASIADIPLVSPAWSISWKSPRWARRWKVTSWSGLSPGSSRFRMIDVAIDRAALAWKGKKIHGNFGVDRLKLPAHDQYLRVRRDRRRMADQGRTPRRPCQGGILPRRSSQRSFRDMMGDSPRSGTFMSSRRPSRAWNSCP